MKEFEQKDLGNDFIDDYFKNRVNQAMEEYALKLASGVELKTNPKPKYIPKFFWKWILGKVLVVEIKGRK